MLYKIGITEQGDASLDFKWFRDATHYDGMVLITKNITGKFMEKVLFLMNNGYSEIVIHATCTGWGATVIEPGAPTYCEQLRKLQMLLEKGFTIKNCVLRIDPIFPTMVGVARVRKVLNAAYDIGVLPDMRVRISLLDEYKHVKDRFRNLGYNSIYGERFFS